LAEGLGHYLTLVGHDQRQVADAGARERHNGLHLGLGDEPVERGTHLPLAQGDPGESLGTVPLGLLGEFVELATRIVGAAGRDDGLYLAPRVERGAKDTKRRAAQSIGQVDER